MAKFTVKIKLWEHDSNAKNQHPIYLQVTIDRVVRYIATGYHVRLNEWDPKTEQVKKNNSLADSINADISDRLSKIVKFIVEANLRSETITASIVKDHFSGGRNLHNFFDFADSFQKEVRNKRKSATRDNYKKHLKKLELYHESRNLSFEEITVEYLTEYENELLSEGLNTNYVHKLLTGVRTIFNAAVRKGVIQASPFRTFEMPKYVAPDKDYLTLKELDAIEELIGETKDPVIKQSAVYLLLGCYTGLRISDWFKFDPKKNIKDGRVYLRATKNNEWVTMPVAGRFKKFLPRLEKVKLEIEEPTINEKLKKIASELEIDKYVTSHTGRHTFAITMCAEQGISAETCAELMGITVKTCVENYYSVTKRKIDKETLKAWRGL